MKFLYPLNSPSHKLSSAVFSSRLSEIDELPQQKLSVSVSYQHGTLQTNISNLQTSEVEILEINWSDTSSQEEYTRCRVEILRLLGSHKFPKVKRLVLNNLFYSSELVENLVEKFPNIEHLKILPFNSKDSSCMPNFKKLRALRELEIALRLSDDIILGPPTQLKELTVNISKVASDRVRSSEYQCIVVSVHATHSSLCKCSYG